jgi:glycosyltransferase involved in cell wall biosynthesis
MSLTSCIMPTYNRHAFVPQAIYYFLRQGYPNKELIIVDDGTDEVSDLIPGHERIRYIRLPGRQSIGESIS